MDSGLLFLIHEAIIIHQGTEVLKVAEECIGIGHVLVGIVKIAQKQLAPKVEVVQSFGAFGMRTENLVKLAH